MQPSKAQLNRPTRMSWLQQELHPKQLLPSLTAALIIGTIEVIYAISFVALIFPGDLAAYLPIGIGLSLFTSMVVNLITAYGSSVPGVVAGTQDVSAVILGVMVTAIAARFPAATEVVLPTILTALALTSILTGIGCFLLGQFKLGNLIRFIPYPVVGGFLAGTGWLLLLGSLSFMTNLSLPGEHLQFFRQQMLQWLPGCCFAMLLLILLRRYHHFLLMPGLIVGAMITFYAALLITHTSIAEAQTAGLLLFAFPEDNLWHPLSLSDLVQADWTLILPQAGQMIAVLLITVISVLLNSTGIELATGQDMDLNRELRVAGIANLASGLGGGIIGFHLLGVSILSCGKLGVRSRMVGVFIAVGMAIVLSVGAVAIPFFPKLILGGITLFLGLDLLFEWVCQAWFRLSKTDYFIVILILIVIATVGFLQGVAVGLIVSIVLFVIKYSQVQVTKHTLSGATYQSQAARSFQQRRLLQAEGDQIYILELQGFLFFGTANTLLNQIRQRLRQTDLPPLKFIVLSFRAVTGLDSSAVLSFTKLQQICQQRSLVFTNLSPQIQRQFQQGGVLQAESSSHIFPDLDRGLEWCEDEILNQAAFRRKRSLPLLLQLNDLFSNRDYASAFMDYLEEWDADAGTIVFQQNQPATALYLIEVGQVTLYFEPQPGQTHRIQTLGAGNLLGELDFFRNATCQTSAVVDLPSTLYRLSTGSFQQMQQEKPEVAAAFQSAVIQVLGNRLTSAYQEIADLLKP